MTGPAEPWRTWAGDESCVPAVWERPGSVTEVVDAVGRAAARDQTVRVAGSGHSFTPVVLTDGTLLSLERMSRVLDVDTATGLVRAQAGVSLNALSETLWDHGLALENLGDVDVQSIAGATATGTHGTGARLRNLSAALVSVELVAGDGTVHELSATDADGGDAWRAARVSVGALGVITAVTVRTVPAFVLRGLDAVEGREQVLQELDARAAAHDHFELFAFPYAGRVITRTNDRVHSEPRPRGRVGAYVRDELLTNKGFEAICRLGRARPSLIPRLNRAATALGSAPAHVDRSYRVFATPRSVRFNELEYAIPREHAATAVRAVLAMIEERRLPISFPLELRTVAPDDALLSPAGGRETAYVAAHVYQGMEWQPYLREVEAIMRSFDGRPHWGKRHFRTAADLKPAYPEWEAFQAVRDRLDPGRRFTNPHIAQILGP
ncbi:MAG: FAD-linked oxidoreductase [Solirubrobacterales bacterium]|nr:FAD-linked oxidoreductase [Solirubrobacterales bacterium]